MDAETHKQTDAFLAELLELTKGHMIPGDYSDLFAKYPLVRLCIRRAIIATRK